MGRTRNANTRRTSFVPRGQKGRRQEQHISPFDSARHAARRCAKTLSDALILTIAYRAMGWRRAETSRAPGGEEVPTHKYKRAWLSRVWKKAGGKANKRPLHKEARKGPPINYIFIRGGIKGMPLSPLSQHNTLSPPSRIALKLKIPSPRLPLLS